MGYLLKNRVTRSRIYILDRDIRVRRYKVVLALPGALTPTSNLTVSAYSKWFRAFPALKAAFKYEFTRFSMLKKSAFYFQSRSSTVRLKVNLTVRGITLRIKKQSESRMH